MIRFTDLHPVLWQQNIGLGLQWLTGIQLSLPAGYCPDGLTFVRLTGTGEIVLVESKLLTHNTCREDEREAERLAAEASKKRASLRIPQPGEMIPKEVAVCPRCGSQLLIDKTVETTFCGVDDPTAIYLVCCNTYAKVRQYDHAEFEKAFAAIDRWLRGDIADPTGFVYEITHTTPYADPRNIPPSSLQCF